jgi:hypothetical protein
MNTKIVYRQGKQQVTIPAGAALAVFSTDVVTISRLGSFPQLPNQQSVIGQSLPGVQYVTATFASGAILIIEAGAAEVQYEIGTAPVVRNPVTQAGYIPGAAANAVNATATLTVAQLLGQIITSTTAAAVAATLPTATIFDAGSSFDIGDWVDVSVINTGGANAFTMTTAAGWTLVGNMVVALSTSSQFRIMKTAAAAFTCFRIS